MPPAVTSKLDYALALCDDQPMAPRPAGIARAFREVLRAAERARVRIVVCGAFARNAYLRPRTTDDADFLVATLDEVRRVVEAAARSFTVDGDVDAVTRLVHRKSGGKVDLMVAEHPFEREAIERAEDHPVRGERVPVVPADHLTAMKVEAASDPSRPEDFGEAARLLLAGAASRERVDEIVRRDLPACVPTWEAILRAVDRARAAPPSRSPRARRQ
jgi:hypothetical protein